MTCAEPRIPRAFAGPEIGDRQNRANVDGFMRPVSNAVFSISGIAGGGGRERLTFRPDRLHSAGYARAERD
jgi:hypothetical protein